MRIDGHILFSNQRLNIHTSDLILVFWMCGHGSMTRHDWRAGRYVDIERAAKENERRMNEETFEVLFTLAFAFIF